MADMRALLRRDRGEGFAFEEALALSGRHDVGLITGMITGLVAEGFLLQSGPNRWECTDKGRAMQWTSRERVTRDKAEQRLAEVVARASVINADENYAMIIAAVVVFGGVRLGFAHASVRLGREISPSKFSGLIPRFFERSVRAHRRSRYTRSTTSRPSSPANHRRRTASYSASGSRPMLEADRTHYRISYH
jgi:hypothetical protein